MYTPPTCESSLCSYQNFITKFIKDHQADDIDVGAYDETSTVLLQALNQADFLAYSSVFAGYGNGGNGIDYIDESHKQVKKAINVISELISIVEN